jgi:hypothetical protein
LFLLICGTIGCSDDGLHLAPVEGVVLFEGKPVVDASVMFAPAEGGRGLPAVGTTNEEGKFTLVTANRPGALVGAHRVAISKTESTAYPQRRGLPTYKFKEHLPPIYGSFETSGLTATVKDEDNQVRFDLSPQ